MNTKTCDFSITCSVEDLKKSILDHLTHSLARDITTATNRDWWVAMAFSLRDKVVDRFIKTMELHNKKDVKRVYYLSLEYLMGRLTKDGLNNTGLMDKMKQALEEIGLSFDEIVASEVDMGLGNGGLGRLAACFLDSMATLDLPAVGYGIRYEFGLFTQSFNEQGKQEESPDNWLKFGSPWEIVRPEYMIQVKIGGHIEQGFDSNGNWKMLWKHNSEICGIPWDVPIVGYGAKTVNYLRLWESRSTKELDLDAFNRGGYTDAVHQKAMSETVSKVLYPNDKTENGKYLRLLQQYFFVTCSIQDIIRRYLRSSDNFDNFSEKVSMQLNDTHPAIGVAELMRIFIDDYSMDWDKAWGITRKVFAYTNHTLLPEALEKWSVQMFEKLLPRHLQIIYEINSRFLQEVEAKWPGDDNKKRVLSIIEEGSQKMVRMAYLAVVGSHSVNGVAALHTLLLKSNLFSDFDELYPEKINNKTNGITPRRWLKTSNPELAKLFDEYLKDETWVTDLDKLKGLEKFANDKAFQNKFMSIKKANKEKLAKMVLERTGIVIDTNSLFDVQIKRLHEYKRQHLNLLHILYLYKKLLQNPNADVTPRTFIFGAKAAPGYDMAKAIIHAINAVAKRINNDDRINGKLKVVFIPNYNVTSAMCIIPAADLSEQISTAGKEASGTGNMKLALNGALTIGTLDGANVEIKEEVKDENIFIFGMNVDEVQALKAKGYNPYDFYNEDEDLRNAIDWLGSDFFTPEEPDSLKIVQKGILDWGDPFMVCADFRAYCNMQEEVANAYKDKTLWAKMAILNSIRMGKFSSDRTISEYAKDIWNLPPCK